MEKEFGTMKIKNVTKPFPIDTERFRPGIKDDRHCFVYFKKRNFHIQPVVDKLIQLGYQVQVFHYGSYNENDYLQCLKKSKFGVWIGCSESQGFALQEALSCNCPLMVFDASSVFDE